MNTTIKRLIDKSIEAFILGLEIYNKPTLHYRLEGFSFFITNAWELMLKAELLKRKESIYYKNTIDRTLSINDTIERIYTDKNQPLRLNLEKIIELRNTSTHFITEDYETIYVPFFQANVFNFIEQIKRFHDIEITKYIAQNFLTLSVNMNTLSREEIRAKYTPEMAEKIITTKDNCELITKTCSSNDLFIAVQHNFLITKKPNQANLIVGIDNSSNAKVQVIKELQDPNDKYKLTYNNVISAVNKQLNLNNFLFNYSNSKGEHIFNTYCLKIIINFYNLKQDKRYSFKFAEVYRYSQQLVEFIMYEIKNNPDLIENILHNKKITPGT